MASLTLLLSLLWLGVAVSTVVDLQKRILGGADCGPKERLYHVRLRLVDQTTGETALCGGSLISDQWILTAAHCLVAGRTLFADLGVHPGPAKPVQITDPPAVFKDGTGKQHDIMLLKLPSQTKTQTVPLPNCNSRPKLGATIQIAGQGASQSGPNNARQPGYTAALQCADTTVADCADIMSLYKTLNVFDAVAHERWICGKKPHVDICKGDSGGGMIYQNKIYGVISKLDPSHTCRTPCVFMDICHKPYIDWIKRIIAKEKKGLKCLNCG